MTFSVVDLISIQIVCLGHFMPSTFTEVASTFDVTKKTVRLLFVQAACITVSCRIFSFSGPGSIGSSDLNFIYYCML